MSTQLRQRQQNPLEQASAFSLHLDALQQGPTKTMAPSNQQSGLPPVPVWRHTKWRTHSLHLPATSHRQRGTIGPGRTHVGIARPSPLSPRRRGPGDKPDGGIFQLYPRTFLIDLSHLAYLDCTLTSASLYLRFSCILLFRAPAPCFPVFVHLRGTSN